MQPLEVLAGPLRTRFRPTNETCRSCTDFINRPFDPRQNNLIASQTPYDAFAMAFAHNTKSSTDTKTNTSSLQAPYQFDRGLQSPLGFGSPYSEFLASPAFDEDPNDLELPALDFDFPGGEEQSPLPEMSAPAPVPSSYIVAPPAPAPLSLDFSYPAPTSSHQPAPTVSFAPAASTLPLPLPSFTFTTPDSPSSSTTVGTPSSTSTSGKRRSNGYRASSTPLVALDAPIQSRSYILPTTTSRKRKTTAVERELLKRGHQPQIAPDASTLEAIPKDLVQAAERKRLQNTLSARKSRARRAQQLEEMEEKNRCLEGENDVLKARVRQLEEMLAGMGLSV